MTTEQICKKLNRGHHILSKDYGDGHGRQYWLRDKDQQTVATLTVKQFIDVQAALDLGCERVISSDAAYWYQVI